MARDDSMSEYFREMAEKIINIYAFNMDYSGSLLEEKKVENLIADILRAAYSQGYKDGVEEQFDESEAFKVTPNPAPSEKI